MKSEYAQECADRYLVLATVQLDEIAELKSYAGWCEEADRLIERLEEEHELLMRLQTLSQANAALYLRMEEHLRSDGS
ncbi:MAG: hypothetical protein AAFV88_13335 [Planctomycetota bacterium]